MQFWLLAFVGGLAIWANFGLNLLSLANPPWFAGNQTDSEALVVARLVQNHAAGKGSDFRMLGYYTNAALEDMELRFSTPYRLYTGQQNDLANYTYDLYRSQYGGQAVPLGWLDDLVSTAVHSYPLSRFIGPGIEARWIGNRVQLLQLAVAAANAFIIVGLILWFVSEFGLGVGWCLVALTLASPWLSVFGRNLYWMVGTWFVPLVTTAWLGRWFDGLRQPSGRDRALLMVGVVLGMGGGIFIKSTMGYEYMSTITLAQFTVVLFYALKWGWRWQGTLTALAFSGFAAVSGFAAAVQLHLSQLAESFGGSRPEALEHFRYLISHRAVGNPSMLMQKFGTTGSRLGNIFCYVFLPPQGYLPFFLFLIPFLIVAIRVIRKKRQPSGSSIRPLAWATVFSFSAPLSWYVLAKGHSLMHPHINYILWHLPTMFFGAALVSVWLRQRYGISLVVRAVARDHI